MQCVHQKQAVIKHGMRSFSTTASRPVGLMVEANKKALLDSVVPAYPYPTQLFKRSAKGLYGGARIRFGNNTAEKYKTRTRRTWLPNVHRKRLYSEALGVNVQLPVVASVLRTIQKVGGLDEYLLGIKEARIKELGETGWWLRWAIMQTTTVQKRFAAERAKLGLKPAMDTAVERDSNTSRDELLETATVEDGEAEDVDETDIATFEPLMQRVARDKERLIFRVAENKFLHLRDGKWQVIALERQRLSKLLRDYTPARLGREFDRYEDVVEEETRSPLSEAAKKAWFAQKQDEASALEKARSRAKPWQEVDPNGVGSDTSLPRDPMSTQR